jgi:hypothetical protein
VVSVGIRCVNTSEQLQTTQGECRLGSVLFSFVHEFQRNNSAFSGSIELDFIRDDDDFGVKEFTSRGAIGMQKIRHREAEIRYRIKEAVNDWVFSNGGVK